MRPPQSVLCVRVACRTLYASATRIVTNYYLGEQQYAKYAADAAVWTTLADQRKTDQAQLTMAEEQAEKGICLPCSPSASSAGPRRSRIYSHFKHLADGSFTCLCCWFCVMNSTKSTSALFSYLKRRHYSLYLQLATGSPQSRVSVDPPTCTLQILTPFCQAFAHNCGLSNFFEAHLRLPPRYFS